MIMPAIMLSNAVLATILAGLVYLLAKRVRHPPLVHLLWVLVLLKLLAPPLVFWRVPLPAFPAAAMRNASPPQLVVWRPGRAPARRTSSIPLAFEAGGSSDAVGSEVERGGSPRGFPVAGRDLAGLAAWAVWLGGCLVYLGVCWRRHRRLQRWLRHARAAPAAWQRQAEALARRLGLRRAPSVWQVSAAVSPMVVFGRGGPRIVIPAELARRWDEHGRAAILLHELAHIRRRDHWFRRLELVVRAVYWWYPVVGWIGRQLRAAEEQCCDLVAVEGPSSDRRHYAQTLLDMVDFLGQSPPAMARHPLAVNSYSTFSSLKRRLTMLLNDSPPARFSWRMLLAVGVLAALALPVGVRGKDAAGCSAAGCDGATAPAEGKEPAPEARRNEPSAAQPSQTLPPDGTRLEMNLSTSRVLVANQGIRRVQVGNPDVLELTALSARQIRITAKKPGATRVTLWDEDGKRRTLHVTVSGAATYVLHVTLVEFDGQGRRKVLAEPSLVTLEGKLCYLHVGAELPHPASVETTEPLEYGTSFRARVFRSEDRRYLDATLRTTDVSKADDTGVCLEGKELRFLRQFTLGEKISVPFEQIQNRPTGPRKVKMRVEVTVEQVLPTVEAPSSAVSSEPDDAERQPGDAEGRAESERSWPALGLTLRRASPDAVPGRYRGGLEVVEVRPDGPAVEARLRPGDVLLGIGKWETTSPEDVDFVLGRPEIDGSEPVKFYIGRGKETLYGHLAVPRQSSL